MFHLVPCLLQLVGILVLSKVNAAVSFYHAGSSAYDLSCLIAGSSVNQREKAEKLFQDGEIYFNSGKFQSAIGCYRQALRELGVSTTNQFAHEPTNYTFYEIKSVNLEPALAGQILRRICESHTKLAVTAADHSESSKANTLNAFIALRSSIDAFELARGETDPGDTRKRLEIADQVQSCYDLMVMAGYETYKLNPSLKTHHDSFFYAERARSRLLLELRWSSTGMGWGVPNSVKTWMVYAELVGLVQHALDIEKQRPDGKVDQIRAISRFLKDVQAKAETVRSGLRDHVLDNVQTTLQPVIAEWGLLQRDLGIGETILEYYVTNKYIYIFVIPNQGDLQFERVKLSAHEIANKTMIFISKISDPKNQLWEEDAKELFIDLIGPVKHYLKQTERLIIVPHQALHLLPFQALVDPIDGRMLLDRFAIHYLPAANLRFHLGQPYWQGGSATIVGIDKFNGYPNLRHSEAEAISIKEILGDSAKLFLDSRREVEKTRILGEIVNAEIIHISTHGVFEASNPLFSHLVLKDQNGKDNQLFAFEILGKKLKARLITLSACRTNITSLNAITQGDELLGFPWVFIASGARRVVVSLWNVDEESTKSLMQNFYRNLMNEAGDVLFVDQAIQNSQFEVRKNFPHPYYWAPFILIGDP